jgi:hypothetical protein
MSVIFWIAVAACAVAQIAILRSTFVVHRSTKSELVPAASRTGELILAFVPAVALSLVLVATWQRLEARESHMMDHSRMNHAMPMPSSGASAGAVER